MVRCVTNQNVHAVLQALSRETTNCELQMSIMVRAIIAAAKVVGVSRAVLLREIDRAWEDTRPATATLTVASLTPVGLI